MIPIQRPNPLTTTANKTTNAEAKGQKKTENGGKGPSQKHCNLKRDAGGKYRAFFYF